MSLSQYNRINKFGHHHLTHFYYWTVSIHFFHILIGKVVGLSHLFFNHFQIFLLCLFLENFCSLWMICFFLLFFKLFDYPFLERFILIQSLSFRLSSNFWCFLLMKNAFRFIFCLGIHCLIIANWFLMLIIIFMDHC